MPKLNPIHFFLIVFCSGLLMSCVNSNKNDITYSNINNKELEKQIINFSNLIDSLHPNTEYLISVEFLKENDSITTFELNQHLLDSYLVNEFNFNFVSKVGDKDVVFIDYSSHIDFKYGQKSYFSTNRETKMRVIEHNFPNDYKKYIEFKKNNPTTAYDILNDQYGLLLVFKKGCLVKREYVNGYFK